MRPGYVRDFDEELHVISPIYVQGENGLADAYYADIDTGFTGALNLPISIVMSLDLDYSGNSDVVMANGQVYNLKYCYAEVYWIDRWQHVKVLVTGDRPLIGMKLLRGYSLCLDAVDQGEISIRPTSRFGG